MNLYIKYCIIITFCSAFFLLEPTKSVAQTQEASFISQNIPKLNQASIELSQNVLAMLTLIKEYEKSHQPENFKIARITKPVSPVKETDNINSLTVLEVRLNEEYLITEEHDKWYRIRTNDNRSGWLSEDDVQVIMKQPADAGANTGQNSRNESAALLSQIARLKIRTDDLYAVSASQIKEIEVKYNNLSNEEKLSLKTDYQLLSGYKEKIEKYHNYAVRYIQPYEKFLHTSGTAEPIISAPGEKFKGTISADIGRSSYNNMNTSSTTSRRLSFDGAYQIDKATNLNFLANHQNELIQSAFTNNTLEAGFTHQFADKLT